MPVTEVNHLDYCETEFCSIYHKKITGVAIGVVTRGSDKVLIAQRQQHQKLASCWEFPGGKMFSRESTYCALRRELMEEVNIYTQSAYPLLDYLHHYDHGTVHLCFWHVTQFTGAVRGTEGQRIKWVSTDQIGNYQFLAGNQAIITLITKGLFHNKSITNKQHSINASA